MKVQFGSGGNQLQGWMNTEYPDHDITKPLKFPDNSVEQVLAEHVVEHTTGPQGFRFMCEVRRILKPGGVFRICVPELARLDLNKRCDIICNHGHLMVYAEESLRLMLEAAGFSSIERTGRKEIDGHHRQIGEALDSAETLRMEATK